MAVTLTDIVATPHYVRATVTQDGNAGTTLTIANADMQTAATTADVPANAPLRRALDTALANKTAAVDFALRGIPASGNQGGCARISPVGVAAAWAVDADEAANALSFNIVAPAGADSAIFEFHAVQSTDF